MDNNRPPTIPGNGSNGAGDFPNNGPSLPNPPPLPPRPANDPLSGGGLTTGFGNPYTPHSNYGTGGLYGNGMYGNGLYGGGSSMYGTNPYSQNQFGFGGPPYHQDTSFVRIAEESSRNAFQSVESVVTAVSSVSVMLESSLNAVYSSFRAVLGVAEQFERLRTQLGNVVITLSLFRWIQWLWRRFLVLVRLKPKNYANFNETAWNIANSAQSANQLLGNKKTTSWPTLIFFAIAIGGPYLIWKLISKIVNTVQESKKWTTGERPHYEAKALYDFTGMNQSELGFRAGEIIRIAPKDLQPTVRGWLLGSSVEGQKIGLLPINYVEILGKRPGKPLENNKNVPQMNQVPSINYEDAFNQALN